jgi:hypothetical protein
VWKESPWKTEHEETMTETTSCLNGNSVRAEDSRAILEGARETWEQLRAGLFRFFTALAVGKTYTRRTDLGVVLTLPNRPGELLRFRPRWGWSGRNRVPDPEVLVLDVVREWTTDGGCLGRAGLLDLTLRPGGSYESLCYERFGAWAPLYREVVAAVRGFLADPDAAFTRCINYCGICHRELTDPVSQGRGIGPECAQRLAYLRWVFGGRKGDPPPVQGRKPRNPRAPQGKVVHSNQDETVLEYSGPAVIVSHCAVAGRRETPVRWFGARPPARCAQYETAVTVWFKKAGQRKQRYFDVVPDNFRYLEIVDAAGVVLWDSRRVVSCDMAEWEATRARMDGRPAFTVTRYDSSGAVVNDGPGR